ncbi:MAG TPA: DUF4258 domain-containing protein [Ktedonobacterales bacterium]
MANVVFSKHARDVMRERHIPEEWVLRAIATPDRTDTPADGIIHYIKAIPEHGGRFLRLVVNLGVVPQRVVTAFFDRRLGRQP